MSSNEAPKTPQPKRAYNFTTGRVAGPTTPSRDPASPVRTPPTAAKSFIAAREQLVNEETFDYPADLDPLLQEKRPAAPRQSSAWSPVARQPLAERPQAAVQPQPSAALQKRRPAPGDDPLRKRRAAAPAPPPQRPRTAPRPPPAARAPPTALAPVPETGGGRAKRPAGPPPNGCLKFKPTNPYPKHSDRWKTYEQYKGTVLASQFFMSGGRVDYLMEDKNEGLVEMQPQLTNWLEALQRQPKKAKTGSQ